MIKCGQNSLIKPIHKLFNLVLNSGYYPQECRIVSLHKKGDPNIPSNYRGITISSVLGKLFNFILINRLTDYLDENNILCPEQSGFGKQFRTSDHMLCRNTKMTINVYIYIAFIDFKQAFDTYH